MKTEKPYFMTDETWFYFDEDEFRYKLTDSAPKEAQDSYKEYYNLLERNLID